MRACIDIAIIVLVLPAVAFLWSTALAWGVAVRYVRGLFPPKAPKSGESTKVAEST